MPNIEDYMDDPPEKIDGFTQCRCISHPNTKGNYTTHLVKDHWGPPVEEDWFALDVDSFIIY